MFRKHASSCRIWRRHDVRTWACHCRGLCSNQTLLIIKSLLRISIGLEGCTLRIVMQFVATFLDIVASEWRGWGYEMRVQLHMPRGWSLVLDHILCWYVCSHWNFSSRTEWISIKFCAEDETETCRADLQQFWAFNLVLKFHYHKYQVMYHFFILTEFCVIRAYSMRRKFDVESRTVVHCGSRETRLPPSPFQLCNYSNNFCRILKMVY
jgi:hypothetical protein